MAKVVTYETPSGSRINICPACEAAIIARDGGHFLKNSLGEEYCQVYMGLHEGRCDECAYHDACAPGDDVDA